MLSSRFQQDKPAFPKALWEVYLRYKLGTRAIAHWLVQNGKPGTHAPRYLRILDLQQMAGYVEAKRVELPDHIDFQFRETISARRRLTKYYLSIGIPSSPDEDTVNHEYFTESLQQIYNRLRNTASRHHRRDSGIAISTRNTEISVQEKNTFEQLAPYDDHDEVAEPSEGDHLHHPTEQCDIRKESTLPIDDDSLGEHFEILKLLQDLCDQNSAIQSAWQAAGRGEVPIMLAAFTTNLIFKNITSIFAQLRLKVQSGTRIDSNLLVNTPPELRSTLGRISNSMTSSEISPVVQELEETLTLLEHGKSRGFDSSKSGHICYQKPSEFYSAQGSVLEPWIAKAAIIENVKTAAHNESNMAHSFTIRRGSPFYLESRCYLIQNHDTSCGIICGLGVQVVHDSYLSYVSATCSDSSTNGPKNCRLEALQFAAHVQKSIGTVLEHPTMPCRCFRTLAFHLEALSSDLKSFLSNRAFDLYSQSPWISGSHMLEIHEASVYYGLRLLSYRHYSGSLLHLYNMFVSLNLIKSIPIFEALCTTFHTIVFPAGRPQRSFHSSWMRFLGGRLRFKKGRRSHGDFGSSWHMAIPSHDSQDPNDVTLKKEVNDSAFQTKNISLLSHIKENEYRIGKETWDQIYSCSHNTTRPTSPSHGSEDKAYTTRSDHGFLKLQSHISDQEFSNSFTGEGKARPSINLPPSRLNYFAIYLLFADIVGSISDGHHDESYQHKFCLCFVETLTRMGDRIVASGVVQTQAQEQEKQKQKQKHKDKAAKNQRSSNEVMQTQTQENDVTEKSTANMKVTVQEVEDGNDSETARSGGSDEFNDSGYDGGYDDVDADENGKVDEKQDEIKNEIKNKKKNEKLDVNYQWLRRVATPTERELIVLVSLALKKHTSTLTPEDLMFDI